MFVLQTAMPRAISVKVNTNRSGLTFYKCVASSFEDGSHMTPNWFGIFRTNNKCNMQKYCYPVDTINVTDADNKLGRIQTRFSGVYPLGFSSVNETVLMTDKLSMQIHFLGQSVAINLSQDSKRIDHHNPLHPEYDGSAIRDSGVSAERLLCFYTLLRLQNTFLHYNKLLFC